MKNKNYGDKMIKKRIILVTLLILSFLIGNSFANEIIKGVDPGRVFLLDKKENIFTSYSAHEFRKYSPKGKLIVKIGRKGEGPGDIKRMGWFAINPIDNNIYVTEFVGGNRWISFFSTDGKYMGEWKIEIDWSKYNGLQVIKFDNNGNAYIQTYKSFFERHKDFSLGYVQNSILKFSPKGKFLGSIYKFKSPFMVEKRGKGNITIPFHNYLYWDLWDEYIAVREHYHNFISLFNLEGQLIKKLHIPFKREKLEDRDIEAWLVYMKQFKAVKRGIWDLKYWKSRMPFPKYKPVSGYPLFFDRQGNIFSANYTGYQDTKIKVWAKINIRTGKHLLKSLKKYENLVLPTKGYLYFEIEKEDNYILVKMKRSEYQF